MNTVGLGEIFAGDGRSDDEREHLVRLISLFRERESPPDSLGLFPRYAELREQLDLTFMSSDGDAIEEAFLNLYCHVHGHEAPYTVEERRRMDETGGYWCHAGGISPILKAGPHIRPQTVLGDFGAGNGLQGLLIQKLFPHRKTIQIEISSQMVGVGKELQQWLDIPEDRVEWIVGDVLDYSPDGMDFIYLYRPVRPEGEGVKFYERFAESLAATNRQVVIFSIADCLRSFLPPDIRVFYTDGHLTCFRRVEEGHQ